MELRIRPEFAKKRQSGVKIGGNAEKEQERALNGRAFSEV
jgi:hypothetical protein